MPRRKRQYQSLKLGTTPSPASNRQPRLLHPETFLYFFIIVLAVFGFVKAAHFFPQVERTVIGPGSEITTGAVLNQTNQLRTQASLTALRLDSDLSQAALSKGQDMLAHQYWSHTSPDGTQPWDFIENAGYSYRAAGENLARDFATTDELMTAWMASPTHQENILNPKFEEIGIAVITGKLNNSETTLVVQMFGSALTSNTADDRQLAAEQTAAPPVLAGAMLAPDSPGNSAMPLPLQLAQAFFAAVIFGVVVILIHNTFFAHSRKISAVQALTYFTVTLTAGILIFLSRQK